MVLYAREYFRPPPNLYKQFPLDFKRQYMKKIEFYVPTKLKKMDRKLKWDSSLQNFSRASHGTRGPWNPFGEKMAFISKNVKSKWIIWVVFNFCFSGEFILGLVTFEDMSHEIQKKKKKMTCNHRRISLSYGTRSSMSELRSLCCHDFRRLLAANIEKCSHICR